MADGFVANAKAAAVREWRTVIRFFLVGGSSFGVKAAVYAVLSRMVWESGPRSVQNVIAILISMVYNYSLHNIWTFRAQKAAAGSARRYVGVVVVASVLDAVMFYLLHDKAGLYDFGILVFNALSIAMFTFLAHRLFTFHSNPWKRRIKIEDVVQSG